MRSFTGHLITTWGRLTVFRKCPPLLSDAFTSQEESKDGKQGAQRSLCASACEQVHE